MIAKVKKSHYRGEVQAPPAKSFAHRYLIAAALTPGETHVENIGKSQDVEATLRSLSSLGADVRREGEDALIGGITETKESPLLDAGESGSTLRFLLPLFATVTEGFRFTGTEKLLSRPNDALFAVMGAHGATVCGQSVRGRMQSGVYKIDATISSQYITGLLMALPLAAGDSRIILDGPLVSAPYIAITLSVLRAAGIAYREEADGFTVFGNQTYRLPAAVRVEGDWSSAAFPLVAGALGEAVTVRGISPDSLQGDREILEFLRRAGAHVACTEGGVTVSGGAMRPFCADIEQTPDLGPVLAVLAAAAPGESRLYGVSRLAIKESNRIEAILSMLHAAGISAEAEDNCIKILGSPPSPGSFSGENDHRIVMSACLLAGLAEGESCITTAEAVKKSYPDFFGDFERIGGCCHVDMEG